MPIVARSYDQILAEVLADYENQLPDVDRSQGSLVFINSAMLASAVWGVERFMQFIAENRFPDTGTRETLERWAAIYNISRDAGEDDASLLSKVLLRMQQPEAGGNRYDWPRWAREVVWTHTENGDIWIETIPAAYAYENQRGSGSVDVIITSDLSGAPAWVSGKTYEALSYVTFDGDSYITVSGGTSSGTSPIDDSGVIWVEVSGVPSTYIVASVESYLNNKRPLGIWDYAVSGATRLTQNVTMTITGVDASAQTITDAITAYIKSLEPSKTLYTSQLIAVAIDAGAESVVLTTPSADVVPSAVSQRVWPGTVTVTKV